MQFLGIMLFNTRLQPMEMSEKFDKLKKLQDVLSEKYEIQNTVNNLPKSLQGTMESLEQFKSEFLQKNEEYESIVAKINGLHAELDETTKYAEESEKNMDTIQTHRDYENLSKKIDEAKAKENDLRGQIAKVEKNRDQLKNDVDDLESLIHTTEDSVNEEKASLDETLNEKKDALKKLEKEEAKISEGLDSELLYKFQRIIQRNKKGIVTVKGNVCDGCQMILPANFANEVRDGDKIMYCPYCSRVLFYEEGSDAEENFFSLEDTGSLADVVEDGEVGSDEYDYLKDDEDIDSSMDF